MDLAHVSLAVATLLCSLVAGFVFCFAVVIMPGITRLGDREFLRAFQVVDGVIQDNQPAFVLVWAGSIPAIVAAAFLGVGAWEGAPRTLLLIAAGLYLVGVQLPTFTINVPLNNRLKELDLEALGADELRAARRDFEGRWVRWNTIRTLVAVAASALLLFALLLA